MVTVVVVGQYPGIQVSLQFFNRQVNLAAERHLVELLQDSLVKPYHRCRWSVDGWLWSWSAQCRSAPDRAGNHGFPACRSIPSHALDGADVGGVLAAGIAWVGSLELTMGSILFLLLLQRLHLRLS